MTDGRVKQVQAVLQALGLESGVCRGIEPRALAAVRKVDGIDVVHKVNGFFLAYVLVKSAAEFGRDIVFAVRECSRAAEAVHNSAGLASDTGLDLLAVDGAFTLREGRARLENGNLLLGRELMELVSGEDTSGSRANNYNVVIFHSITPLRDCIFI